VRVKEKEEKVEKRIRRENKNKRKIEDWATIVLPWPLLPLTLSPIKH
jgi:hypothetical protein